jgi:hypothetical protein
MEAENTRSWLQSLRHWSKGCHQVAPCFAHEADSCTRRRMRLQSATHAQHSHARSARETMHAALWYCQENRARRRYPSTSVVKHSREAIRFRGDVAACPESWRASALANFEQTTSAHDTRSASVKKGEITEPGSTRNCTGFCTDCLHPGLTGVYWPFRGMLLEVVEAKGRRFIIRSL